LVVAVRLVHQVLVVMVEIQVLEHLLLLKVAAVVAEAVALVLILLE
jgi:hypothetical protein